MKETILETFLQLVKIDSQSNENSNTFPSTEKQFNLAHILVDKLQALGLKDATCDKYCYVTATLEANVSLSGLPVIGLFAHIDTSPEVSGANVHPQIIHNYSGGDIILDKENDIVIYEFENKHLKDCLGHTIVTTDGTTLLGSDDKAGITTILALISFLNSHPEIPHGKLRICFSPDEETGRGISNFDISKFGANYAYTIDGGFTGEINKETFSADSALIKITGRNIHPGSAKDRMVNSIKALAAIISRLPEEMSPEHTEGYEPFIHPMLTEGSVSESSLQLLLRDFETSGLTKQKELLERIINEVKVLHPKVNISLSITPSYRNMRDTLEKFPHVTERLETAVRKSGIQPVWTPIRGGTDGSKLTSLGLPTPNIFTGSCNSHSITEWQSIDALVKIVEILINLVTVEL